MQIVDKPLKDLKPYANNPRHNAKAVKPVKESILKFGFKVPIVIDKNNVIVCGHTRFYASKEIGLEKVPCIVADDLTQEQIDAFRLVDNRTAEFADWNFDKLAEELSELQDFDFEPVGFDDLMAGLTTDFIKENDVKEDDYEEEIEDKFKIKYGDVITLNSHKIICGDATKEDIYEKLMEDKLANMVFTDPPYGVSYVDKNDFLNRLDASHRLTKPIENDNKKPEDMFDFWVKAFSLLNKFSASKMSYYITAPQGGDLLLLLLQAVRESGFMLKHQLVWNKNNHVLGRCDYNYKHEPIIYGWKIGGTHSFYGNGKFKTSVWDIPKPLKSDLHPTMKPIELVENAILDVTVPEDLVIDGFLGSGTTLMAAEKTNRICYGIELDPHYCNVIIERYKNYCNEKNINCTIKINGETI